MGIKSEYKCGADLLGKMQEMQFLCPKVFVVLS